MTELASLSIVLLLKVIKNKKTGERKIRTMKTAKVGVNLDPMDCVLVA